MPRTSARNDRKKRLARSVMWLSFSLGKWGTPPEWTSTCAWGCTRGTSSAAWSGCRSGSMTCGHMTSPWPITWKPEGSPGKAGCGVLPSSRLRGGSPGSTGWELTAQRSVTSVAWLVPCYSVTSSVNQTDVSSQVPSPPLLGPPVRDWMADAELQTLTDLHIYE